MDKAQRREYNKIYNKTYQRKTVIKKCERCGVEFRTRLDQLANGLGKFCGRKCANQLKKWRGGRHIERGYVKIYTGNERYEFEHRLVVEKHIGRKLRKDEVVHHINRIKTDNRIENLQIVSPSEHRAIHGEDLLMKGWSRRHDKCTACGLTDYKHQANGMCAYCYIIYWRKLKKA